jgi:hypothetical protein
MAEAVALLGHFHSQDRLSCSILARPAACLSMPYTSMRYVSFQGVRAMLYELTSVGELDALYSTLVSTNEFIAFSKSAYVALLSKHAISHLIMLARKIKMLEDTRTEPVLGAMLWLLGALLVVISAHAEPMFEMSVHFGPVSGQLIVNSEDSATDVGRCRFDCFRQTSSNTKPFIQRGLSCCRLCSSFAGSMVS